MEHEALREVEHIRRRVTEMMRVHAFVDAQPERHEFQYLVLDAFEPPICWDVFRRPRRGYEDDFVLVQTSWDRARDEELLGKVNADDQYPFAPSIHVSQLKADPRELQQLSAQLRTLTLEVGAVPAVCGIDGVTFELALEQSSVYFAAKWRVSWWCKLPPAWAPLDEWLTRAIGVFDTASRQPREREPSLPLRIRPIDDPEKRQASRDLFWQGEYATVVRYLSAVAEREQLTAVEQRLLQAARERSGGSAAG